MGFSRFHDNGQGWRFGDKRAVWRASDEKASGYNLRALVEADIGRWKRVIGEALHSQTDGRQATEVAIAVNVHASLGFLHRERA